MTATTPGAAALRRLIVSVEDLDAAARLYCGALQLTLQWRRGDVALLRTVAGVDIHLHRRPVDRGDAAVAIGFRTSELDRVLQRWVELGGGVVDPPELQPWGERMAVVRDVDGHIVCLSDSAPPDA